MIGTISFFNQITSYLFVIFLPILALYIVYLVIVRAFRDMGFSALEAIVIVFASFVFGSGIIDGFAGVSFSDIPLFTYHEFWQVGINVGGAVIPLLLSIYLAIKNKLRWVWILLGISIVAVITFLVTYPDPEKGIVSQFPFWFLPAIIASLISLVFTWKVKRKAAPLAYILGTLGVLIGADCFHLFQLLENEIHTTRNAVIGGASVFDMVFITGILAVFLDSLLTFQQKRDRKKKESEEV
jgi:uncharacterized membrane protein